MSDEREQIPENAVSICGCGFPLVPVFDEEGRRVGVNHGPNPEQEDHHLRHFAGLRVEIPEEQINE